MFSDPLGRQSAPTTRLNKRADFRLRQAVATSGFLLLTAASARAQQAGLLTARVQLPEDGGTMGHIWVVVTPEEGRQNNIDLAYGLYPKLTSLFDRNPAPTGSRGAVNSDSASNWDFEITYSIDAAKLALAQKYIEQQRSLQQQGSLGFDMLSANSADFVLGLTSATGLSLPRTANGFGVNDPATLGNALRQLGDGATFGGGTVSFNSSSFTAAATIPLDFSHAALLSRALITPATLASQVSVPLVQYSPSPVSSNGSLSLALSGITLNESLVAVDWGDGSDFGVQSLNPQHVYASAGTYSGRLVVLEDGAVHSVNFTTNVSLGGGSATLPVSITNQTDVHVNNAGTNSVQFLAVPSHWKQDVTGSWLTTANWTTDVPNASDAWAIFDANYGVTSPTSVVLSAPVTAGTLEFDTPQQFTINGSSTITLAATSGLVGLKVDVGSHIINTPIVLNNNATIDIGGSGTLQVLGGLSAAGRTISKDGNGRLVLPNLRTGTLNILQDRVRITSKTNANDPTGTSVLNALSIAPGTKLDLSNNSLIIDYTGGVGTLVSTVRGYLQSGQIIGRNTGSFATGYGDNASLNFSTFGGMTVDSTSILVKSTYDGDANLDGLVDIRDLQRLASSWHTNAVWTGGDFNYDGYVDSVDLGLLARSWQAGVGAPLGLDALSAVLNQMGLPADSVPEPTTAAILAGGLIYQATYRRRRRGRSS